MRSRFRDTPAVTQSLGTWKWKYQYEGTGSWRTLESYSNWSPGVAQDPFSRREACWDEVHKGPPYNEGGPLEVWDSQVGLATPTGRTVMTSNWGDKNYVYEGAFSCAQPSSFTKQFLTCQLPSGGPAALVDGQSTWGEISSYGPLGWNKFRPGQSIADLAVFLGEIKEVPRMLMTTANSFYTAYTGQFKRAWSPKKRIKVAAENWLNTQYGWLPFIRDLRNFYKAWKVMDDWYNQLVRDNGQWVRRRGTVTKYTKKEVVWESSSQHMSHPNLSGHPAWYPYGTQGSSRLVRYTQLKVWFEAAFRYYVPDIGSVKFKRRAIQHLFGANVTPLVVWELIPWSWLVDWYAKVGELLLRADTGLLNNLAAKYAYVMGKTLESVSVISKPAFASRPTHTWTHSVQRKSRKEGGHFGFNLLDRDLSAKQWMILGSLGATRLH